MTAVIIPFNPLDKKNLGASVAEAMLGGYVSTAYSDVLLYAILFTMIIGRPEVLGLTAETA